MKFRLTVGALLLAVSTALIGNVVAAEQHERQASQPSVSEPSTVQPQGADPMPKLGNAEDMLKAMESMPAHDHDACCSLPKPQPKTKGNGHSH